MHGIDLGFKKKFPQAANKICRAAFSRNRTASEGVGDGVGSRPRAGEVGGTFVSANPRCSKFGVPSSATAFVNLPKKLASAIKGSGPDAAAFWPQGKRPAAAGNAGFLQAFA
jgi:hypothetical protein